MGVSRVSKLDCNRGEDDLSLKIRELTESIAHLNTYKESIDTGMMELELNELKLQQAQRHHI
jgi:hypothetical protein